MKFLESEVLKTRIDEAIRLSRFTGDEFDKVVRNSPDADPEVKKAAGLLFKPSLWSFARDKFRDLLADCSAGFINKEGNEAEDPHVKDNDREVVGHGFSLQVP